jgi:actin-related protein 8
MADYSIHFPVKRGELNIHPGVGGSLSAIMHDLETIWSYVIEKLLRIPLKNLPV